MALGGEGDFTGKLRLPLPETFSGNPADWEEWSWNFKAYISMFEVGAVTLMDRAETRTPVEGDFTDEDLETTEAGEESEAQTPDNEENGDNQN